MRRAAPWLLLALACVAQAQDDGEGEGDSQRHPASGEIPLTIEAAPAAGEIGRGIASWYGPRFHGRRTASGERFDMHALTAAHPSLPFGTVVRVRSLVNGREVEVRINDRGPHIKQRVIDLSRAAAKSLGLLDSGAGTKPVLISLP
ncbi:septal ring lytic transglycosylase RlpA family protein [uncultured Ramlibacter sp.]|uniref:septal ring lytic transglycosylase RlpA family protein n=1 Tax=uncultured Ramlibacter sp. TaxID=260755 RepID=UPI00345C26BF